ncbi:MAG: hypothetical protein QNJ31_08765 [Candidatus Caenarcaniphilales bacterium]|nr:hypothetical protein [Candidatus Caenarcaniphilales bacterium]
MNMNINGLGAKPVVQPTVKLNDGLPKPPKFTKVTSLQNRADKVSQKIGRQLKEARNLRYSAEVDTAPPLPLTSTTPTRSDENIALAKLSKGFDHIQVAHETSNGFFTGGKFLEGQSVPSNLVEKPLDQDHVKSWRRYNDGLMELTKQRDIINAVIHREGQAMNSQRLGIVSGNERNNFSKAVTQYENQIRGYKPPQEPNNNQTNNSETQKPKPSEPEVQPTTAPIGFQID